MWARKVNAQVGEETGSRHRWSCLSGGTMAPSTGQTIAVVAREAHGDRHRDEAHEGQHRDEDLDQTLQNLGVPIQSDPPVGGSRRLQG